MEMSSRDKEQAAEEKYQNTYDHSLCRVKQEKNVFVSQRFFIIYWQTGQCDILATYRRPLYWHNRSVRLDISVSDSKRRS